MGKRFGETLREQMTLANIKESELAETLSYDATYINKWINGRKLPSARNAESIIKQISDFFSRKTGVSTSDLFEVLKTAYVYDSNYINIQTYSDQKMSLVTDINVFYKLTRDVVKQAINRGETVISVDSNFDMILIFGAEFRILIKELAQSGVEKIKIKMAIYESYLNDSKENYASDILEVIGGFEQVEMSLVSRNKELPSIMTINDIVCVQILWAKENEFAAVFSTEKEVISKFSKIRWQSVDKLEKLLDPAEPVKLKKTNVQITSYSDKRQWLLFKEPPAMLFPDEIMDIFIAQAKDEEYGTYLKKLKMIFSKWTRHSEIDLVFFASTLNKYLSDGKVSVGNVPHILSQEQVRNHINYLSKVMEENDRFRVWIIRDTVLLEDDIRQPTSLFIDTKALYIENSSHGVNDNFHVSMNPKMREIFQSYFERILEQSYCDLLTSDDLQRYI